MTTTFNDATKAFWRYLVGKDIGVNEIDNDDILRMYMELDGISGDVIWPGYAIGSQRDLGWVSVKQYGAVGNGVADDTAAIQAAFTASSKVYVPSGTYLVSTSLLIQDKTFFALHMDGRFKRIDNSPRNSIVQIVNSQNIFIDTIRTDGNAANNTFAVGGTPFPVDEAKHDVRVDNCTNLSIKLIHSINPAGDSIYIAGGVANNSSKITIDTVMSISDAHTGRNGVSIIKGTDIEIGKVLSLKTGHQGDTPTGALAMPSGVDLEPNIASDIIDRVSIGQIIATSAGNGGFCAFSNAGKIISNVNVGSVYVLHEVDTRVGTLGSIIKGCSNLHIGTMHLDGANLAGGLSVDSSDNVTINDLTVRNSLGIGITVGATAALTDFKIYGTVDTCSSHGVLIYNADRGLFDLRVRNHDNASWAIIKNAAAGTSSDIEFRGSLRKGASGGWAFGGAGSGGGSITNWFLNGVDFTGWTFDRKIGAGTDLTAVKKANCRNLTEGTGAPSSGVWGIGDEVKNSAPAVGSPKSWICTVSGSPGTWVSSGNL